MSYWLNIILRSPWQTLTNFFAPPRTTKLVHVTTSLNDDREKVSVQDVQELDFDQHLDQNLVPESVPTDNTEADREQVQVQDVDHYLVTESSPDDSIDVNCHQLEIFNFDSVGQCGYPIGPIAESVIEDDDDDADSAMEYGDEEEVTAGETDSDSSDSSRISSIRSSQ